VNQISLAEYRQQIESAIEDGRYEEAVSDCRNILEQYPKYVSAFWLLGKAMLQAGENEHAADMFRRVLGADPEHMAAWVGMGKVAKRRGEQEAAVWYLERAFELATDNEVVASELRHLYGELEGSEPERLQLTQGALARLYLRGDLVTRAITELRKLLEEHPDRLDLKVALAEALWRNGQRLEASEVCQEILDERPYNLKANLILGEIWTSSGRAEGELYLEQAQVVDPENQMAQELFGPISPLPPESPPVTPLEHAVVAEEERPDWVPELAQLPPAEEVALVETGEVMDAQIEIPAWLQEAAGEAAPAAPPADEVLEEEAAAPAEEALDELIAGEPAEMEEMREEEVVEWLRELEEEEEPAPGAVEEEIPAWLAEIGLEAPAGDAVFEAEEAPLGEELEPGEIPDWLRDLAPPAAEQPEAPPPEAPADVWEEEGRMEEAPLGEEPELAEIPDWLRDLAPPAAEPPEAPPPEAPVDVWEEEEPVEEAPLLEALEETGIPAWLESDEMPSGDEALAWLEQLAEGEEEELLAQAEADAEARMAEIMERPAPSVEEAPAIEEAPPEAPEEAVEAPTVAEVELEMPVAEEPVVAEEGAEPELAGELPAWLATEDMPSAEEALSWLEGLFEGEEELRVEAEAEAPVEEDVFGWTAFGEAPIAVGEAEERAVPAPPEEEAPPEEVEVLEPTAEVAEEVPPAEEVEVLAPMEEAPPEEVEVLEPAAEVAEEVPPAEEVEVLAPEEEAPPEEVEVLEPAAEVAEEVPPAEEVEVLAPEEEAPPEEVEVLEPTAEVAEEVPPAKEVAVLAPEEEVEVLEPAAEVLEEIPPVEEKAPPAEAIEEALVEDLEGFIATRRAYAEEHPKDHEAWLDLARLLWQADRRDEAAETYGRLITRSKLLDEVIPDLEDYVEQSADVSLQQALGDAYMKADRLAEALDMYRRAMTGL
jgi:tetratricopeptide (TPR) repeat protein